MNFCSDQICGMNFRSDQFCGMNFQNEKKMKKNEKVHLFFVFFSFRSVSGYLVRHHHSLFSFSKFNFTIMSNMNLLSFNFDSCTQSHPHNLRAFEVKICLQIFCTGGAQTPTNCKKSRNENEFKMKAKKREQISE